MRDDLGNRMKAQYEARSQTLLPRRTYTLIRIDGKTFHTYTRGLERPYDTALMEDMDATAQALCEELSGVALAYVQSDEISLLLTDFASEQTQAWFDGNVQKICSLSASIATAAFNLARYRRLGLTSKYACFDARAFTIPDPVEVENYFIWRQQDATRNSICMAARAHYSHKQVDGKSADVMQEMLWQKGVNWNDYPAGFKRGRVVVRRSRSESVTFTHRQTGETKQTEVERFCWQIEEPPVFTRERQFLRALIPKLPGREG